MPDGGIEFEAPLAAIARFPRACAQNPSESGSGKHGRFNAAPIFCYVRAIHAALLIIAELQRVSQDDCPFAISDALARHGSAADVPQMGSVWVSACQPRSIRNPSMSARLGRCKMRCLLRVPGTDSHRLQRTFIERT